MCMCASVCPKNGKNRPESRWPLGRAFGYLFIDGQSGAIGLIFASANQTALQYDNGVIMKNPFQSPTTFAQEAR